MHYICARKYHKEDGDEGQEYYQDGGETAAAVAAAAFLSWSCLWIRCSLLLLVHGG